MGSVEGDCATAGETGAGAGVRGATVAAADGATLCAGAGEGDNIAFADGGVMRSPPEKFCGVRTIGGEAVPSDGVPAGVPG